jgi:hypothetical protein
VNCAAFNEQSKDFKGHLIYETGTNSVDLINWKRAKLTNLNRAYQGEFFSRELKW